MRIPFRYRGDNEDPISSAGYGRSYRYATLIDDQVLPPDMWMLTGLLDRPYGTRVYRCRVVATHTAGDPPIFDSSAYSVLWQSDADMALLGWTSSSGSFQTAASLSFPYLLSATPLVCTAAGVPDSLGLFSLPDSITIALTDTFTGEQQITDHRILEGLTTIRIIWDPMQLPGGVQSRQAPSAGLQRLAGEVPEEWRLYYPFNRAGRRYHTARDAGSKEHGKKPTLRRGGPTTVYTSGWRQNAERGVYEMPRNTPLSLASLP